MKKVVIGCDHAAFELKDLVVAHLQKQGYEVDDQGCHGPDSVDYPDYAQKVARVVLDQQIPGILICGTGIGISIAANKIKGIRAALCHTEFEAQMCRNHNDANVLCMGARVIGQGQALALVDRYLDSDFEGGRHQRRVDKMMGLEG